MKPFSASTYFSSKRTSLLLHLNICHNYKEEEGSNRPKEVRNKMSGFDSQRQDSLKRRWQERRIVGAATTTSGLFMGNPKSNLRGFPGLDDDLVSSVIPPVTIVLEGRSICHRINLHKHASYHSLAKALRQIFVDSGDAGVTSENDLDLSNAIPGHIIAYEDIENDLLLAGDLNWKDFVRVAKRIRILPVKSNPRKGRGI